MFRRVAVLAASSITRRTTTLSTLARSAPVFITRCFSGVPAVATSRVTELRAKLSEGPGLAEFISEGNEHSSVPQSKEWWDSFAAQAAAANITNKSVLVDGYNRFHTYLRISLTEKCNLRCVYCMPEQGVELQPADSMLSVPEIMRLASLFVGHGVNKIRLTGGEPLVRKDIVDLSARLASLPGMQTLGVTTNGLTLNRKLADLHTAGVSQLNISLDTLNEKRFSKMTRRKGFQRVLDSIDAAAELYDDPVKVNCVVMRGLNCDELSDFVEFTRSRNVDVRFIEWMPFGSNRWDDDKFMPYVDMLDSIRRRFPDIVKLTDDEHDTSKAYGVPGFTGRFGFITSMSEHFCGSCNRLRLTADGNLKVCLFGSTEVSLRDAMRAGLTDAQLSHIIHAAVGSKKSALGGHGDMYGIASSENRPMILIGG